MSEAVPGAWGLPERIGFLSRIRLFEQLPETIVAHVGSLLHARVIRRGEFAFLEDEPADALDLLAEGVVKVVRETAEGREVILRIITPGEIFGGAGGWSEPFYPATAVAQQDSVVLQLRAADFSALLTSQPEFAVAVVQELGQRLRDAEARIRALQTERVERRIARVLLHLARKTGVQTARGLHLGIPLARQDVADLCGTTLSTASRTLSTWAREGLVGGGRSRITLLRPDALAAIAEAPPD